VFVISLNDPFSGLDPDSRQANIGLRVKDKDV